MSARQIMSADDMRRALVRVGHEIVEKHGGAHGLALVGIEHRGPALAERIATGIEEREGVRVPVVALDVTPYRDDRDGVIDPDAAAVIPAPALQPFDPTVTTIVPLAEQSLKAAGAAYENREIDFLSLISAERNLRQAKLKHYQALGKMGKSLARLEQAVGITFE